MPKFGPGCVRCWAHTAQFKKMPLTTWWEHQVLTTSHQLWKVPVLAACLCHWYRNSRVIITACNATFSLRPTLGGNVWCLWGAKTTSARYFTKEWSVRNMLILLYSRPLTEMASRPRMQSLIIETTNSHPRARAPASKIRPASKTASTPSRYSHVRATIPSGQPLPCSKIGEATKSSWTSNLVPASLVWLWSALHLSSQWSGCSDLWTLRSLKNCLIAINH